MDGCKIAALIFLIWAVIASAYASMLKMQLESKSTAAEGNIVVSIGFKVGNESIQWFNQTQVRAGSTLLNLTCMVANVNYTVYPGMGTFVNCINDVCSEHPYYWFWWYWAGDWYEGPVAADRYVLANGDVIVWYYEDSSASPLPKP